MKTFKCAGLFLGIIISLIQTRAVAMGNQLTEKNPVNSSREEIAYDAPDQAVWHAPSKTWFVSNLGGGISLERDNYGKLIFLAGLK